MIEQGYAPVVRTGVSTGRVAKRRACAIARSRCPQGGANERRARSGRQEGDLASKMVAHVLASRGRGEASARWLPSRRRGRSSLARLLADQPEASKRVATSRLHGTSSRRARESPCPAPRRAAAAAPLLSSLPPKNRRGRTPPAPAFRLFSMDSCFNAALCPDQVSRELVGRGSHHGRLEPAWILPAAESPGRHVQSRPRPSPLCNRKKESMPPVEWFL